MIVQNIEFSNYLETGRMKLRPVSPVDTKFFESILGDAKVRKYLGGVVPSAEHNARFCSYLAGVQGVGIWIASTKSENNALGLIVLNPHTEGQDYEISYQFLPAYWGKGYAREAVSCVIKNALQITPLSRVIAETQSANLASIRLLKALGMHEVQRLERFGAEQVIMATSIDH